MKKKSICLVPEAKSLGGPRTFQKNLIAWAQGSPDIEIHFDASREDIDAFLVIGGPKKYLGRLLKARRQGIPVVHRLNGMNWIHRRRKTGLMYYLHAEAANLAIAFYRRFVCSRIVYQSPFCEKRWNSVYGSLRKPAKVIFNGTDIRQFRPGADDPDLSERIDFLLAEGSFRYGMDFGLDVGAELAEGLSERLARPVCMHVAGKTTPESEKRIRERMGTSGKNASVIFEGVCSRDQLIGLEQKATFFFSSEIHAACPNAVIEAMACGLPVIGFDTGALKDVTGDAGIIVPYGTDPWRLEKPLTAPLISAAEQVVRNNAGFRTAARLRAEAEFSVEKMAEAYIGFCLENAE